MFMNKSCFSKAIVYKIEEFRFFRSCEEKKNDPNISPLSNHLKAAVSFS